MKAPSENLPAYLRIARGLAEQIASGARAPGTRLPPQRDLAYAQGVTLGTVSRAYAELQREGLIDATVGRGSFVRGQPPEPEAAEIDLRANRPPRRRLAPDILRAVGGNLARLNESLFADRIILSSDQGHSAAARRWLADHHGVAPGAEPLLCASGQHALASILMTLCRPGDVVVTEELTYIGLIMLARTLGLRLVGVETDAQGLVPEALAEACDRHRPRLLVITPTFHSPTTAVLPEARRRRIAALARSHRFHIVEDDVYGAYAGDAPPPFRTLLPGGAILFTSFSKVVAPGIAVGLVSAPDDLLGRIYETVRVTGGLADPLTWEIVATWIGEGLLDEIVAANRAEIAARTALAREAFAGTPIRSEPFCPHILVPLPPSCSQTEFVAQANAAGIRMIGSDQFAVDRPRASNAVRISLSAAPDRPELARALAQVRGLLSLAPGIGTAMA